MTEENTEPEQSEESSPEVETAEGVSPAAATERLIHAIFGEQPTEGDEGDEPATREDIAGWLREAIRVTPKRHAERVDDLHVVIGGVADVLADDDDELPVHAVADAVGHMLVHQLASEHQGEIGRLMTCLSETVGALVVIAAQLSTVESA